MSLLSHFCANDLFYISLCEDESMGSVCGRVIAMISSIERQGFIG